MENLYIGTGICQYTLSMHLNMLFFYGLGTVKLDYVFWLSGKFNYYT